MVNPPLKPFGRSLTDFKELNPVELAILDACRHGKGAGIAKQRPDQPTEYTVRASFLRFLALGGDEYAPVHEVGVGVFGAWIDGILDFDGAILPHGLCLVNCHFSEIRLTDSNVHGILNLNGSYVEVLDAIRLVCSGSILLSEGFIAIGKVTLHGAQIGGELVCEKSEFNGKNDSYALSCRDAVIKGNVSLSEGFIATGLVCLDGAEIGGSLSCSNAVFNGNQPIYALDCEGAVIKGGLSLNGCFNGTVCLKSMQIGGSLDCSGATFDGTNGYALQAENMAVAGALFFNNLKSVKGKVSLSAARISSLVDDVNSWMGELYLDGFVYDRLIGENTLTDAKSRIDWLKKQRPSHLGLDGNGKDFKPQPWQQLQKVLREMGHLEDARQVAIAFEDQLRKAKLIKHQVFHWLFGKLIGYGYRPMRLFCIILAVWLVCGVIYWNVALYANNGNGVFAPSNPLMFQNPEYAACVPASPAAKLEGYKAGCGLQPVQGAGNWYLCEKLREEYTGFSPLAYSLDLILPLVDLQQEHDWAPMIPTPENTWIDEVMAHSLKHVTRLVVWFEILFGWMSSLLLVAVISGLTKRQEE